MARRGLGSKEGPPLPAFSCHTVQSCSGLDADDNNAQPGAWVACRRQLWAVRCRSRAFTIATVAAALTWSCTDDVPVLLAQGGQPCVQAGLPVHGGNHHPRGSQGGPDTCAAACPCVSDAQTCACSAVAPCLPVRLLSCHVFLPYSSVVWLGTCTVCTLPAAGSTSAVAQAFLPAQQPC